MAVANVFILFEGIFINDTLQLKCSKNKILSKRAM